MSDVVLAAVIATVPSLATVVVVVVVLVYNRARLSVVLDRMNRVSIVGVLDLELAAESLVQARTNSVLSETDARRVVRRAARAAQSVAGFRVLWVDDEPRGNDYERQFLRSIGVVVQTALTTNEALAHLDRDDFDLVITDIAREESVTAGLELVQTYLPASGHDDVPVVGYVLEARATTPPGFRAVVDRPDELIHQVLDVAERRGDQTVDGRTADQPPALLDGRVS